MEFDFLLVELIKEFNQIVDGRLVSSILNEWEDNEEDDDFNLDFPKYRPMFRTYSLKEIFKYIELTKPMRTALQSSIAALENLYDNLPSEEVENELKYQSALRVISMYKVLSHINMLDTQLKLFFLKSKRFLLDCSLLIDEKDRIKRKDLPHVSFPNLPSLDFKRKSTMKSPTKLTKGKLSIIDRRMVPRTPPIKTRRSDLVVRASNDFTPSTPPRSPYLMTHSITSPPSPLVTFKRNQKTPVKPSQRRSWSK